ncbi:phthiocerol/phenolphthiocerol synthesis type-I polyketide synthase E [Catenulispora sp. EB89]|uniref:beta-ketoacyl synthase N-terminal-like domain-containing protein n=1 Tax=Catenulispora sp. EB89 TaxID=3156257 RepID=UPI003512D27A
MTYSDSDVAIIGMACRFPGADSIEKFWQVLREGRETLTRYTDEELLAAGVPAHRLADPHYVKAGQSIPGIDLFDAELFGFTRDEAEILDPQHRIFLECALEALERAGYDPDRTDGQIGVYAGAGMNTYLLENLAARHRDGSSVDRYRLMLANDKDFLATRLSYKLNLSGPSLTINTACSTSLVALHTACLALLSGECDVALVGAVHLGAPGQGYQYQDGMIFSPDGRCRAFDAAARGTVIGSGAGVVVLKPLKEAQADGDWIHAVITGSAVNNDGSAKTGYTAPSITGQAAVIADAHEVAGVEPDTIGYVEAHGTGTPLGDPIEVAALTEAFRLGTDRSGYCALGSVKTNIGHLDTAAGMAGLIKTVLMLEHRTLVPSLHFTSPNPEIDFGSSPFFVNTATTDWADGQGPLRAGVSSFGIGGTNAHVIVQQAPARTEPAAAPRPELLVVSARSSAALHHIGTALARHLKQRPDLGLGAVAQTLAVGRKAHAHRLALVANSTRSAAMALAIGDAERLHQGVAQDEPGAAVFVLSGAVDPEAAVELYGSVPAYRDAVDACVEQGEAVLRAGGARAAFAHEYALARTLIAWGIAPAAVAATGTGHAVAAAVAQTLPVADALAMADGAEPARLNQARLPVVDLTELDTLLADTGHHAVRLDSGLLDIVAAEWVRGAPVDFAAVYTGRDRHRLPLPTAPLRRERYWVESAGAGEPNPVAGDRLVDKFDRDDPAHNVELITGYLVEEIGRVLGNRDRAGLDSNLFDLNLDSLLLIEIGAKLARELGFEVPTTAFLEFPTIRSFVANLAELLGLAAAPGEKAVDRMSRRAQRAATMRNS